MGAPGWGSPHHYPSLSAHSFWYCHTLCPIPKSGKLMAPESTQPGPFSISKGQNRAVSESRHRVEPLSGVPADRQTHQVGKNRTWQFSGILLRAKEEAGPGFLLDSSYTRFSLPFWVSDGRNPRGCLHPHRHPEFSVYVWRFPRNVLCVKKDSARESIGCGAAPRLREASDSWWLSQAPA